MGILIDRDTKLLTIGLTGKQGSFHSLQLRDYGTNLIGGVTPGKGGTVHEGFPVFNTVDLAVRKTGANAALIVVPPHEAADAILECIDSNIELIVTVTEGIPLHDMLKVKTALSRSTSRLVGPNSPGIITPGESKVGIMPGHIFMPGKVGVISRSGTLTYEAVYQLTKREIGQSSCVGIGGDYLIGTDFIDCLKLFSLDEGTEAVVMIGERGGTVENEAAQWIKNNFSKPVISLIAGVDQGKAVSYGHSGAGILVEDEEELATAKIKLLEESGISVAKTVSEIGEKVAEVLQKGGR